MAEEHTEDTPQTSSRTYENVKRLMPDLAAVILALLGERPEMVAFYWAALEATWRIVEVVQGEPWKGKVAAGFARGVARAGAYLAAGGPEGIAAVAVVEHGAKHALDTVGHVAETAASGVVNGAGDLASGAGRFARAATIGLAQRFTEGVSNKAVSIGNMFTSKLREYQLQNPLPGIVKEYYADDGSKVRLPSIPSLRSPIGLTPEAKYDKTLSRVIKENLVDEWDEDDTQKFLVARFMKELREGDTHEPDLKDKAISLKDRFKKSMKYSNDLTIDESDQLNFCDYAMDLMDNIKTVFSGTILAEKDEDYFTQYLTRAFDAMKINNEKKSKKFNFDRTRTTTLLLKITKKELEEANKQLDSQEVTNAIASISHVIETPPSLSKLTGTDYRPKT